MVMARRYRAFYNLTPPSRGIWIVSLILGVLGILSRLVYIEAVTPYAFWLVAIGFILLVIGNVARGV